MSIEQFLPKGAKIEREGNIAAFKVAATELLAVCQEFYWKYNLDLKTITAFDDRQNSGAFKIMYIFGQPGETAFIAPYILTEKEFPTLVGSIHEASLYERKIKTFFGLVPVGHPNPRTLILHENWPENIFPLRKDFKQGTRPEEAKGEFKFGLMKGEGLYEIPVGPVHAGIIEPGHFRFTVAGEEILLLEPRLGYSHKGSEKLFESLPLDKKIALSERISGDSSFSHSFAFCQALEMLAGLKPGEKLSLLRTVYAELERLANHFGDIGAIMTDTGFNFGGAQGGRLREEIMRINNELSGSRFLRGLNRPAFIAKEISPEKLQWLKVRLDEILADFEEVIAAAENSNSLLNRLKETGKISLEDAKAYGVRGVPAKAIGLRRDARVDYPYASYPKLKFQIVTESTGDVFGRFYVRVGEVRSSVSMIKQAADMLLSDKSQIQAPGKLAFQSNATVISIVEGWRGDIVYVVATDSKGEISRVDVRDPSFLNWSILGRAGKGNVVPDFPLINKSFNLSYSGNDL